MKYTQKVIRAEFISRPNRFIANVLINGVKTVVHVKNTGRCKELLIPGTTVWLAEADDSARKTKYDLICVKKKGKTLINMDSQMPNAAVEEWLKNGALFDPGAEIRREVFRGDSRFDFYIKEKHRETFLEVKGVTLEENGIALFPDAPTERGVKHIHELISAVRSGCGACIVFVIQMQGCHEFRPNDRTHAAFGTALREAATAGVRIYAADCKITPDSMTVDRFIPVNLPR